MNVKQFIKRHPNLFRLCKQLYRFIYKRHIYALTAPIRTLPDFIVFAGDRSGTTSLYHNLQKHPCIYASDHDHLGFFDDNFEMGVHWYKSFFPTTLLKHYVKFRRKYFMAYEVTAQYYRRPWAIRNILKLIPNVKLIAILRNPVDVAYSNYSNKFPNLKDISFEDVIKKELQIIDQVKNEIEKNDHITSLMENLVLARGLYVYQLKRCLKHVPKNQILFLSTEELNNDHNKTFQVIFSFLNLPKYEIKYEKKNIGQYSQKMNSETRKFLINFYKPHNKKLYELIGKNFDWDK